MRLDVGDVDLVHGFALVRGKGGKDRMVPLGTRASSTVQSYIAGVRPELAAAGEVALIVSCRGKRLSAEAIERLVRHACATHMMRRGANLRHVQELLGHKDIPTTEVYTKLTQKELLAAHAAYHPRSKAEVEPDGRE
jgi:site-specific recombinase XerD